MCGGIVAQQGNDPPLISFVLPQQIKTLQNKKSPCKVIWTKVNIHTYIHTHAYNVLIFCKNEKRSGQRTPYSSFVKRYKSSSRGYGIKCTNRMKHVGIERRKWTCFNKEILSDMNSTFTCLISTHFSQLFLHQNKGGEKVWFSPKFSHFRMKS